MKAFLKLIVCCAIVFCSASECTKSNESPESRTGLAACTPNNKKVSEVVEQRGTVYLNKELNKYCIYVGVNGTYDTQIVAVPCNLSKENEVDGSKVIFSGLYYEYSDKIQTLLPGQIYYNLSLTLIKSNDSN